MLPAEQIDNVRDWYKICSIEVDSFYSVDKGIERTMIFKSCRFFFLLIIFIITFLHVSGDMFSYWIISLWITLIIFFVSSSYSLMSSALILFLTPDSPVYGNSRLLLIILESRYRYDHFYTNYFHFYLSLHDLLIYPSRQFLRFHQQFFDIEIKIEFWESVFYVLPRSFNFVFFICHTCNERVG